MYMDLWCNAVNIDVDGFSKEHDHDCVKAGACNLADCTVSISAGAKAGSELLFLDHLCQHSCKVYGANCFCNAGPIKTLCGFSAHNCQHGT